jgi:ElaB/YqjD/DUF883 family membrane-anchored ribosome-binding protein
MASSTERVLEDLQRVVGELEGLVKGAAESAGECAGDAAEGLKEGIEDARERLSDIEDAARKNLKRGLRVADRYVRDNTWESLGTAAAIAFLAGFLVGRRD